MYELIAAGILVGVVVGLVLAAELGRTLVARVFGYQPERLRVIKLMNLPGSHGSQGFRLALILAGPASAYLAIAGLAFGYFACVGQISDTPPRRVAHLPEGFDASRKLAVDDLIVEVEGKPFAGGANVLSEQVNAKRGAPITLVVERAGERRAVTLEPREIDSRWRLGVAMAPDRERKIGSALRDAIVYPAAQTGSVVKGFIEVFKGSEEAEPGGPVRIVSEFKVDTEPGRYVLVTLLVAIYVWIVLVLFDLVRALLLLLFRST
jgi:membrane-associated protease RseP (regulator of RpoE activity)